MRAVGRISDMALGATWVLLIDQLVTAIVLMMRVSAARYSADRYFCNSRRSAALRVVATTCDRVDLQR